MKIGVSKIDITPEITGIGMLGYGVPDHIIEGISTRLFARAFFAESNGESTVIVVAEIAFFTPILRKKIIEQVNKIIPDANLGEDNIMLCAQHTHSAPGGYSYHPFYNISTPGLRTNVLKIYTNGIANAIAQAYLKRTEGSIKFVQGEVEPDKNVSFNRSLEAYNSNEDVELISQKTAHLGVDRNMTLLQFVDSEGKALGSVNWFAVHTTSMPNTLNNIHSDNKGYASLYLENEYKSENPDYVAAFAQGNSGDVTPNFNYDKSKKYNRYWNGPYIEHDRNALFNGRLQFEQAYELNKQATKQKPLGEEIDSYSICRDMSDMAIDPMFTKGKVGACTSSSCLGLAMFIGTQTEGLGLPDYIIPIADTMSKGVRTYETGLSQLVKNQETMAIKRKYKAQGVKDILMETGVNKLFGTKDIKNFILPNIADKTVEWIKHFDKTGAYDIMPMTPQILPYQIIRIGNLAIVAIAFEITTVAGKRLTKLLRETLIGNNGIEEVILSPYSNAYNGYVTTFEEYQVQQYEGGHTVFGQWTSAAVQQTCFNLANEFLKPKSMRSLASDEIHFPNEKELEKLKYAG